MPLTQQPTTHMVEIPDPNRQGMAPPDVETFLRQNGWGMVDVYWQHSTSFHYYTWPEAVTYEMFKKFTLGAFDDSR